MASWNRIASRKPALAESASFNRMCAFASINRAQPTGASRRSQKSMWATTAAIKPIATAIVRPLVQRDRSQTVNSTTPAAATITSHGTTGIRKRAATKKRITLSAYSTESNNNILAPANRRRHQHPTAASGTSSPKFKYIKNGSHGERAEKYSICLLFEISKRLTNKADFRIMSRRPCAG